jgi:hypothetical protein
MKNRFLESIENGELLTILEKSYLKEKIGLLLSNENLVYTKKGRLNKSGACRILSMKNKELETFLEECRKVLEVDQFLEPDEYKKLQEDNGE